MKIFKTLIVLVLASAALVSCKSSPYGNEVKQPFSGSKYESNNKYYRAIGQGSSSQESVAMKKARINAKSELASQVRVTMREVSDNYISETGYNDKDEVTSKLESLTRQVMDTDIADLRQLDQKVFFNSESNDYRVFVAYEIHKKKMYKTMKNQIKLQAYEDKKLQAGLEDYFQKMIDELED